MDDELNFDTNPVDLAQYFTPSDQLDPSSTFDINQFVNSIGGMGDTAYTGGQDASDQLGGYSANTINQMLSSALGDTNPLKDLPAQDFGGADTSKYMDEYQNNLQDIYDNKGGFTSGWQQVGTDRVMVQDDGSAIGINENGEQYSLSPAQVTQMDKNGLLNSAASGYNTATGGTNIAPGGGKTVVNADGSKTVTMSDGKTVQIDKDGKVVTPGGTTPKVTNTGGTKAGAQSGMNPMTMMMLMYLLSQMGKGGGSSSQQAVIPKLNASRSQLPYSPQTRPGAGGRTYFNPTTYTPAMAGGGAVPMGGGGISSLGSYSDGGRLLKGPGDGVSDQIPATIAGKQPARLANGEFVVPARIVSELGNGSTDAGAKRLYEMMDRVQKTRRKTKNVAADTKAHKYLPA
jgi:hypothetical protein